MGRSTSEARSKQSHEDIEGIQQLLAPQADSSRLVFLHGDVTEHSIANVIAQLLHLANTSRSPIHLVVSTYGGSVDEMFSLYDTIKFLPCPVHTVALGKVMSAGVLLLASGVKGKRLVGASARIMVHSVIGGSYGNVFELENHTQEQRRMHDLMVCSLVKETKMTRKQVEAMMSKKVDCYIGAEEAVRLGIVDRIIGADTVAV